MSLAEQLDYIEKIFPEAWEYLHEPDNASLPEFDDDDEVVSWGVTCGDAPHDTPHDEEEDANETGDD